jgi:thiol:disulfide interchange protein
MRRRWLRLLLLSSMLWSIAVLAQPAGSSSIKQGAASPAPSYDPKRDADTDIQVAVAEARRSGRRVLLEVGGQWCVWCHIMKRFYLDHPDLLALRDKNYVTVSVNFSEENRNQEVLSRYPAIHGYPHLFVLGSDGKLLHSEGTNGLEEGRSYNLERFTKFLESWAPPDAGREP